MDIKSGMVIGKAPGTTKVAAVLENSERSLVLEVTPYSSVIKTTNDPADQILMEITFDAKLW